LNKQLSIRYCKPALQPFRLLRTASSRLHSHSRSARSQAACQHHGKAGQFDRQPWRPPLELCRRLRPSTALLPTSECLLLQCRRAAGARWPAIIACRGRMLMPVPPSIDGCALQPRLAAPCSCSQWQCRCVARPVSLTPRLHWLIRRYPLRTYRPRQVCPYARSAGQQRPQWRPANTHCGQLRE
jgi:hypothetical protein